jgi:leucyl aminopeptidase (aminopeptidase T)
MTIKTIYTTSSTALPWSTQPSVADVALGKRVLRDNLGYQPGHSILIVTDQTYINQEAAIWFAAAHELATNVPASPLAQATPPSLTLIELEGMTRHGQVPPAEVIAAAEVADIVLLHTTYSLTHSLAATAGRRNGGRVASMPCLDYEMMHRTLQEDFFAIAERGERLKAALERGTSITITAANGTNITAAIRRDMVINDTGILAAGVVGNLPGGEVFFAPPETSTNGTWVIDASLANETELDKPVVLEIHNGVVVNISGGAAARRLHTKLTSVGPLAFTVAEIGIGTNPTANPFGDLLEAEKALGTAHLAVGANAFIGGSVNVPIHLDGVTLQPTILVDTTPIMQAGTLLV